jgi:23S rRNA (adenine2503-C2)-methyltransferase
MKIIKNIQVPTGNIVVVEGEHGKLEFLSIGDYGKEVNLKCDAMGLDRDIPKVEHKEMLPLEEKWVITVSTQYGCSSVCRFCDVPKVAAGKNVKNATYHDLMRQVELGLSLHPEVTHSKRLNIHYARMGEPSFNNDVIVSAARLKSKYGDRFHVHPVVSTMMPNHNLNLKKFIKHWIFIKNELYEGNAGLQLSINSTNEEERDRMFCRNALSLKEISEIMKPYSPVGRKFTLNFAVADYEINPDVLLKYFDPDTFIIKLTPMHKTKMALKNNIKTIGDYTEFYPYKEYEENLKKAGYDVLVFIASIEEDLGRITCGNAILSGVSIDVPHTVLV